MADQVLRIKRPERAARRMEGLIEEYGVPAIFPDLIGRRFESVVGGRIVAKDGDAEDQIQSPAGFGTRDHFGGGRRVCKIPGSAATNGNSRQFQPAG